jgi:hypothetical protein
MTLLDQMRGQFEQAKADGQRIKSWQIREDLIAEVEAAAALSGELVASPRVGGQQTILGAPYEALPPDAPQERLLQTVFGPDEPISTSPAG